MSEVLRIYPHRSGPWLVKAGRVILGVPPAIGVRLQALNGTRATPDALRANLAQDGSQEALARRLQEGLCRPPLSWRRPWKQRSPVWLRLPLLPAGAIDKIADLAGALTKPGHLLLLGVCSLAGLLLPGWFGPLDGAFSLITSGWFLGIFLLLLSALWHEVGHAAALRSAGYTPGGLGLGLLYVLPVLFVDVTPVALLPRRERLRVNVAGPVFQLSLAAIFRMAMWLLPLPPVWSGGLGVAAASATLAVAWSLWPFIRSDGYWLVCDTLEIPGLDRPLPPGVGGRNRVLVSAFRLANMGFLLAMGVFVTLTLVHKMGIPGGTRLWGVESTAVSVGGYGALVAGIWVGLLIRVLYLGRLFKSDLGRV